jgi:hypothetical protein
MKKILTFSVVLSVVFSQGHAVRAAGQTGPPDLTGRWKLDLAIKARAFDQDCAFAHLDNTLTGICKGEQGLTRIEGSVDGKRVTWSCQSDYNGSAVTVRFDGTLSDGKVTGKVIVNPIGAGGDFVAVPNQ